MRFLLDQDVYALTARYLRDLGHDVVTAAESGLARASDETLLRTAHVDNRILITRDRDYGALVFVRGIPGGVIYLRIRPSTLTDVHHELARVINAYPMTELRAAFIVVTSGGHRIRRLGTAEE